MKKILTIVFLVSCLVMTLNANVQALPYFQTFPSAATPAGWELTPGATISSTRVGVNSPVSASLDWRILFAETGNGVATSPSLRITAGTVLEFEFRAVRTSNNIAGDPIRLAQLPDGASLQIRANGVVIHTITNVNHPPIVSANATSAWRAMRVEIGNLITASLPSSQRISFHAVFPTPVVGEPLWYQIDNVHIYDNYIYIGNRGSNGNIIFSGEGQGTGTQGITHHPFSLQFGGNGNNSVAQQVYFDTHFGDKRGYITHLVFEMYHFRHIDFSTVLVENLPEFKIWMADNLPNQYDHFPSVLRWIPFSIFEPNLVFTGRVPHIIIDAYGSKRVVIELDEPFNYTGGHLGIMTQHLGGTMGATQGHQWFGTNAGTAANFQRVQHLQTTTATNPGTWIPNLHNLPTTAVTGSHNAPSRHHHLPNVAILFAPVENGGELSVFFSTFTATHIQSNNTVNIAWETASESNLSGFHVLRSETGNLADARPVSDFFGASNSTMRTTYNFTDNDITPEQTYYYWIRVRATDSSIMHRGPISVTISETEVEVLPTTTEFTSVYPNPLRTASTATFVMDVKENETASLQVFNVRGQLVREFNNIPAGSGQRVQWDLTDSSDRPVPTGIYFYRLSSPSVHSVQRLVIVK